MRNEYSASDGDIFLAMFRNESSQELDIIFLIRKYWREEETLALAT